MGRVIINKILPEHVNTITEEMSILTAEEQRTLGMLWKKLGKKGDSSV
jgi:hypothetical protein